MRFASQTHPQDDHIGRITDCSTRYGQAHAVSTRVTRQGKMKVTVQVYSPISSTSSDFYIFTPWLLDVFIRVPSEFHGDHTVLKPFRSIELSIHIAISVLPGIHFYLSQVKHVRVKCLAQGHKIKRMN